MMYYFNPLTIDLLVFDQESKTIQVLKPMFTDLGIVGETKPMPREKKKKEKDIYVASEINIPDPKIVRPESPLDMLKRRHQEFKEVNESKILRMLNEGVTPNDIAKKLGIAVSDVYSTKSKDKKEKISSSSELEPNEETIDKIVVMALDHTDALDIAEDLDLPLPVVSRIIKNELGPRKL